MPTVKKDIGVDGEINEIEIDFEIWCEECGKGICGSTHYRRKSDNHFDSSCPNCVKEKNAIEKERDDLSIEVDSLSIKISELEDEILDLREQLASKELPQ